MFHIHGKNMPSYCSRCGAALPETGASFCPRCGAPVASDAKRSISMHRVMNVSGRPKVSVTLTVPGSIDVRKGNDGEIILDSQVMDPHIIDFEVAQSGDNITLSGHVKSWNPILWGSYFFSGGPRANVTIMVPHETDLNLETQTDPLSVNGISGALTADSKTGSIHLLYCDGTINAKTHTGSINLDNINGTVSVRATTGPTRFSGTLSKNENSFRSTTGSIDLILSGDHDLQVDASTTIGQITCSLDLQEAHFGKGEYIGQHMTGKLGTGTGRLIVETTVGSVSIRK